MIKLFVNIFINCFSCTFKLYCLDIFSIRLLSCYLKSMAYLRVGGGNLGVVSLHDILKLSFYSIGAYDTCKNIFGR